MDKNAVTIIDRIAARRRLERAAPDLLEAGKDALLLLEGADDYKDNLGIVAMLRAAIAKAEGK